MGSKKSSSSSTNQTNQYDQRSITTIDDRDVSSSVDLSDRSTSNFTSNWDTSNRSTTNISGADAAAINAQNTDLLQDLGAEQTDAIKAIAQMQAQGIDRIGGAFTDVSSLASNNASKAWTHTIDAGAELLGQVVDATKDSTDSARLVAQAAIASFQPAENKQADTLKYAAIAAAVAFVLLKG